VVVKENGQHLDKYRQVHPAWGDSPAGALWGYFVVPLDGKKLNVISSGESHGMGAEAWEHVSVSLPNRCPTWREMAFVKHLFWRDDELVLQFHPPKKDYVNNMATCLHLWRSPIEIQLPPVQCV
jgi:hypothetical protein